MIGSGVMVTRVELLDAETIAAVNAYMDTEYAEAPSLFIEFGGTEAGVAGDLEATREIAGWEACTSFDAETLQVNEGVLDPTLGYYSPTPYSKGTIAETTFHQGAIDVVVGRRPMTDYDQLVTEWRNSAGEQVRKEYLDAFAANA